MENNKNDDIETILANVKATMSFEGLELSNDIMQIFRKYLHGEYSEKELFEKIEQVTDQEINKLHKA